MRIFLVMAAIASAASPAAATPAKSITQSPTAAASGDMTCGKLAASYEDVGKVMSLISARGFGDDSAPRETNRQLKISNQLAVATNIQTVMVQQKCVLPRPVALDDYILAAAKCALAEGKITDSTSSLPAECDRSTWHRDIDQ